MGYLNTAAEKVRSFVRKTFGNHEMLEEEGSIDMAQEPGGSRTVSSDYTELMGGSVPCPSCKGTGRIPREMEETLVALIPLNDDRLKPKRTWLYVLIGIAVCTLIAGTAIFMLVPRSVDLISNQNPVNVVHVVKAQKAPDAQLEFYFLNYVSISNWNYYSIQVVNTTAIVISKFQPWLSEKSGIGGNSTVVTVAPLSHKNNNLYFNSSVTLLDAAAEYCQASFSRITSLYVNMQFDITVQLKYFNHREQVQLTTQQQVCCIPSGNCTSS